MIGQRTYGLLVAAALFLTACPSEPPSPPDDAPKLILLIVVDQLGADHLARFDDVFEGGFRRLLDEGVWFREARHAHARTLTAPGHATVSTGCHPSGHGIISNYWIDRETGEQVYSVGDERHELAPTRLECSTLGDWIKERYPASRVFSLSGKDRSAILLAGRRADGAYWYDWEGTFTSSSYYRESEPSWLEELNAEGFLESKFGEVWNPLPFEPEVLAGMGVVGYELGPLEEDFPHTIGGLSLVPGEYYFEEVFDSPWLDEYILRLARGVVTAEELGQDQFPDLLAIGFSTSDAVGHGHGPDSREFFDILVRLDRQLGSFFDWLDETVGMDNVAIALTSDHGSVPLPEMRLEQGLPGGRVGSGEIGCMQRVDAALDQEFGEARWFERGPFFAPLPADSAVSANELHQRARLLLEACPSVSRVWLAEDLGSESIGDRGEDADEMQLSFARSFFAGRSPDLLVQWDEYFLASAGNASSHGTPHRYDTHVPLVFWRAGRTPEIRSTPVRTVDIAPTLATWLGIEPPQGIAGRSLALPKTSGNPSAR
ncbi:MAG: alkaline phosphatase family protein [Acidobacteria bacterium]|nr:alkaline phosphatase family protein [Acidobacteriota bacterium]